MQAIISTAKLCKTFKIGMSEQQVLKDLNLDIYNGDFTVIMGSSGSGKSTLLYALSGMDKASSGEISYNDVRIDNYDNDKLAIFRRKNCGFVFQDILLNESMSILDNILVGGFLLKGDKKVVIERAKSLLLEVGIPAEMHNKFPAQMSGGELQRVGFVRALINSPAVVFADEPTGALNSSNSGKILDLFNEFHLKGNTIVMVTHDLKTAVRGSRILYLKDGVILSELSLGNYDVEDEKNRLEKLKCFLDDMGW